jgi:CspA family cold shock protein
MRRGTVKWFSSAKGFGFLLPDGGGKDIFIHYTGIMMDGFKKLEAGEEVVYELEIGPGNPEQACKVQRALPLPPRTA